MSSAVNATQRPGTSAAAPEIDIQSIRQRARQDIETGAMTPGYAANPEAVI